MAVVPNESNEVMLAKSASELSAAFEQQRKIKMANPNVSFFWVVTDQRVVNFGGTEWVAIRRVDDEARDQAATDNYYTRFDASHLISFGIRFGQGTARDPVAIAELRKQSEQVLASIKISPI